MKWLTGSIASLLLVSLGLSGCASLQNFLDGGNGASKLVVQYATLKYIGKAGDEAAQAARAERVKRVIEDVREVAKGDSVSVALLVEYVNAKLPANLDPADRLLANALIQAVANELSARVGDGVLDPDKLLLVEALLGWVSDAADLIPAAEPVAV